MRFEILCSNPPQDSTTVALRLVVVQGHVGCNGSAAHGAFRADLSCKVLLHALVAQHHVAAGQQHNVTLVLHADHAVLLLVLMGCCSCRCHRCRAACVGGGGAQGVVGGGWAGRCLEGCRGLGGALLGQGQFRSQNAASVHSSLEMQNMGLM